MNNQLLAKLAATYEICSGRELSENAQDLVVASLDRYAPKAVSDALDVCIMECKGSLTPADIISRVVQQDGRPSPDEAWALVPKDEDSSACMTAEMSCALGVAGGLVGRDNVAARRAFIEAYKRCTMDARTTGEPIKWSFSIGQDPNRREACIQQALREEKISERYARIICPGLEIARELGEHRGEPRLSGKVETASAVARDLLDGMKNEKHY